MADRHGILDTIFETLSPVHPDGHKFIAIGAAVTLLFFLLCPPLGWIGAAVTAWIVYFFRDPQRVTPLRPGLVDLGCGRQNFRHRKSKTAGRTRHGA